MGGSTNTGCSNAVANAARSYKSTAAVGTLFNDRTRFYTSGQHAVVRK
jgi:hypothetical protein